MNDNAIMKPQAGMTAVNSFGEQRLAMSGETLSSVLAAQAESETKMRFFIAQQCPRSMDTVRTQLLASIERPGFAGSAQRDSTGGEAWYRKPIGKGVEGFSIRFAEEVIRCFKNLDVSSKIVHETDAFRLVSVKVLDLESNIAFPSQMIIEKIVERKYLKKGQSAISSRINSSGEPVHTVEATPDEVLQRQNALISKAIRNAVLRLVPGDILAECKNRIMDIRRGADANDPNAYRRRVCDMYAQIGVEPTDLEEYIGHTLKNITPPEQERLQDLYDEITKGNLSWAEVMDRDKPKKETKTQMEKIQNEVKKRRTPPPADHPGASEKSEAQAIMKERAQQFYGNDWSLEIPGIMNYLGFKGRLNDSQCGAIVDYIDNEEKKEADLKQGS